MIVGHGLIATAFARSFEKENGYTIFASGVSNSSETSTEAFARESDCLTRAIEANTGIFVYFSTCSISDHERQNTPYVQHKIRMEKLVAQLPEYYIFRLPQVVGRTSNRHTLTNYIHLHVSSDAQFQVWGKAWRNIIDVDDVAAIAEFMIRDSHSYINQIINIASPIAISVLSLVEIFERLINKKANYVLLDRGDHYDINVDETLMVANMLGIKFGPDYVEKVLGKYYGQANGSN